MKQRLLALSKSGRAQLTAAAVAMVVAGPTFAAGEGIDTTAAVGYIAAGVAAAALVGGLMFGLVCLVGASKKAQRAGT